MIETCFKWKEVPSDCDDCKKSKNCKRLKQYWQEEANAWYKYAKEQGWID